MRPFFVLFFFISPTHLEVNTFTKPFYPTTFERVVEGESQQLNMKQTPQRRARRKDGKTAPPLI